MFRLLPFGGISLQFPVSIIEGEPAWDSLPAAKIRNYSRRTGNMKPYVQAKVCMSERRMYIRMLSFEVNPDPESRVMADISFEDGKYLSFSTNREGQFRMEKIDEKSGTREDCSERANIRISSGEDEQGIYWCADFVMYVPEIESMFPGFSVRSGMAVKGNFYKIKSGENGHEGSWNPVDFDGPDAFGASGFAGMQLVDY